jgi:apolipoprotein N-acyltransferase
MEIHGWAYSPARRRVVAALLALSRGSLIVFLVVLLFFDTPLHNPLRLIRYFVMLCLAPELAAWLVRFASRVALRRDGDTLVLEHARRRIEIPCTIIDAAEPWSLPIPGSGLWLRLSSGRRFDYGLELERPSLLFDALPQTAQVDVGRRHPLLLFAEARHRASRWWTHPAFKFVVVGLVPAVPLFRLHQWITYGGTFGEYYQYGLRAYVLAFAVYWANAIIWLVLYAAALRGVAEGLAILGTFRAPSYAPRARRMAEVALSLFYYGGIVLFLLRIFLLSRV